MLKLCLLDLEAVEKCRNRCEQDALIRSILPFCVHREFLLQHIDTAHDAFQVVTQFCPDFLKFQMSLLGAHKLLHRLIHYLPNLVNSLVQSSIEERLLLIATLGPAGLFRHFKFVERDRAKV